MKFELKQLNNNIFALTFDNSYDLAMHFLRWTEFTECSDPKINRKHFKIIDFIDVYSRKHDNKFTYPDDWAAFNVSSRVFNFEYTFKDIPDLNQYDVFMKRIVNLVDAQTDGKPFYLIGHVTGKKDDVDHELAHAMYDMMPQYKRDMQELMQIHLSNKKRQNLLKCICDMEYSYDVAEDEAQAYLSTGIHDEMKKLRIKKIILREFEYVFEYHKGILLNGE